MSVCGGVVTPGPSGTRVVRSVKNVFLHHGGKRGGKKCLSKTYAAQ